MSIDILPFESMFIPFLNRLPKCGERHNKVVSSPGLLRSALASLCVRLL
jgi:hypothetical protein